jgi:DNA repair protein RadA/Sms
MVGTDAPPRARRNAWVEVSESSIQELASIGTGAVPRINTSFSELDRVLGGGIVPGAVVLMAGDPGIGKSTLLLQSLGALADQGRRVLYISGEESALQVRMRAERLDISGEGLFFLGETEINRILAHLDRFEPDIVVVDSAQTVFSEEISSTVGSVAQVRECTRRLMHWSKAQGVPVLVAGHVTKDGSIAGPRALEHMVDVVLYLEGDNLGPYRILRGAKNRFGSTDEVGVFQMGEKGLEEVSDPSHLFLSNHRQSVPGSVVIVALEGTRPLLAEVQALATHTVFSQPRRVATGVDFHRLLLVTAALSKRLGVALGEQDIIANVAGGLRVAEPAADLGIALAVVSSFRNVPCDPTTVVIGEVGLGGEIRSVPQIERRLGEAAKLGFQRAVIPETQVGDVAGAGLELQGVATLGEAVHKVLSRVPAGQDA